MLRRAQISIEYLILTGFVLLIVIIPGVIFLSSFANQGVYGTVNTQKVTDLGNGLIDTAKQIYYLGLYSKKIVVFDIPENVDNFFIVKLNNNTKDYYYIGIILSDGKQMAKYFFPSDVPLMAEAAITDPNAPYIEQNPTMSAYVPECTAPGASCSFYNFIDPVLHPGKKRFKMETKYDPNLPGDIKVNIIPLIKD